MPVCHVQRRRQDCWHQTIQCRSVAPGIRTAKAPAKGLSTLNSMAFGLAVYASPRRLPCHDARLASGRWSGATGRAFTRRVLTKTRVSYIRPSFAAAIPARGGRTEEQCLGHCLSARSPVGETISRLSLKGSAVATERAAARQVSPAHHRSDPGNTGQQAGWRRRSVWRVSWPERVDRRRRSPFGRRPQSLPPGKTLGPRLVGFRSTPRETWRGNPARKNPQPEQSQVLSFACTPSASSTWES